MKIRATLFAAALAFVPAFAQAQSSSTGSTGSSSSASSTDNSSSSTTSSGMPTNDSKTSATSTYQPIGSQPPSQTTPIGSGQTSSAARDRDRDRDRGDTSTKKLDQTHLLQKLHHVNQEEVKAGELAQQKGSSSDVKSYGAMLVKDHQQADRELTTLAGKLNVDLTAMKTDQESREKHEVKQHKMEQLQKMTGKDFDRGFAQMMVNGHQQVIDIVKNSRDDVKPDVKSFLDKQLPVLQKHADMAKDLLNKSATTATAR